MIEGINILNQTEVVELTGRATVIGVSFLFLAFVLFLIWVFGDDGFCGFLCGFAFVACLVTICFGPEEPTGRYSYEVTIDDSVNFTDVYERFEVIEQRGDIWVLEDKKEEGK